MAAIHLGLVLVTALLVTVTAQVQNRLIMCDTEDDVRRCEIYCSRQQEGGYGMCDYGVCHCYPRIQTPPTTTTAATAPSGNGTTTEEEEVPGVRIQGPTVGAVPINVPCNTRGLLNHPLYCPFWCVSAGFYDGFCSRNRICNCWQSPFF